MFVDGFKIAEIVSYFFCKVFLLIKMKYNYNNLYNILTKINIEYIEEGYDIHERDGKPFKFDFDMVARHRVIR